MTDDNAVDDSGEELEDDGVLDASDTLDGDPGDDPLDQGIVPADRWSAGERYGTTLAEERAGESLDQLLAQEQPEPDPYADDTLSTGDPTGRAGDEVDEQWADEDVDGLLLDDGPDPRAGRPRSWVLLRPPRGPCLVAPSESPRGGPALRRPRSISWTTTTVTCAPRISSPGQRRDHGTW